jgi:catechol 2,3-dioxygenase-like lactoylglutathione lyase family enzyme
VQVRFARHTASLDRIVGFYRDGLGLPELGRFAGHDGYDGVFLALPGTGAHLEFTTGGADTGPAPHPETFLVLYLGTQDAVDDALRRSATDPIPPANPYWARTGVTIADPDGWRVVLVPAPWVP